MNVVVRSPWHLQLDPDYLNHLPSGLLVPQGKSTIIPKIVNVRDEEISLHYIQNTHLWAPGSVDLGSFLNLTNEQETSQRAMKGRGRNREPNFLAWVYQTLWSKKRRSSRVMICALSYLHRFAYLCNKFRKTCEVV